MDSPPRSFGAPARRFVVLVLFSLLVVAPMSAGADELEVGAEAPRLEAVDQNGETVDFGEIYEQGYTLVYFYPKADTPGCTKQACSLRDAYAELTEQGVHVIGVSTDTVEAQKAFEEKYELPFTLIADTDKKVLEAFGVPARGNFASRQAYLIKDGKLVWRDTSASTVEQATDVLAAIRELGD